MPDVWLALFIFALAAQRIGELRISSAHEARLRARGGREAAAGHFPLLVVVHSLYAVCLVAEVVGLRAHPGRLWPVWLTLCIAAQGLRWASMRALGDRWTVRIWVVPGEPLVTRGPYRFLRHPNYLAVMVELIAGPLVFGAWRTAGLISALNLVALGIRIPAERRALSEAGEVR